jgi:acyl-coenzyme A synthetase/AMP-(fatty) acid ligase
LRYLVFLAATLKTGYVPLFNSPRNSLEGQKFLVEKTNCEIFLTTVETISQVKTIQEAIPHMKVFETPSTKELLDPSRPASHYTGRHSRDAAAHSLILHTSGSTGEYLRTPMLGITVSDHHFRSTQAYPLDRQRSQLSTRASIT